VAASTWDFATMTMLSTFWDAALAVGKAELEALREEVRMRLGSLGARAAT
jgi:hypothetical protein